jgi:hypothetical protein
MSPPPGQFGECGSTGGFHNDAIYTRVTSLDDVEKLLTLTNRVDSRKDRLYVHSQMECSFLRCCGLLPLIVVVIVIG